MDFGSSTLLLPLMNAKRKIRKIVLSLKNDPACPLFLNNVFHFFKNDQIIRFMEPQIPFKSKGGNGPGGLVLKTRARLGLSAGHDRAGPLWPSFSLFFLFDIFILFSPTRPDQYT
ncbi:hypothetical protein AMTRI_Chr04g179770 [Amborella trichopoda]